MKGSKKAVLKLVESSDFLSTINNLLKPCHANISEYDNWMPKSSHYDKEAELKDFLKYNFSQELGGKIHDWWLAVKHPRASTPNWDFLSTCTIDGRKGLILVEAKAHADELHSEGKSIDNNASENSKKNHTKIGKAIEMAKNEIDKSINPDNVSISINSCYQLSNRIAHSWWLANQGIPVVLVYLGFLNCQDMDDGKRTLFATDSHWQNCFINHAKQVGVDKLMNKRIDCGSGEFITICKSL